MSIERSQAIVIKRQELRETSILATFYTKEHGKINGVVKGVRGPLNKTSNSLELFSLSEIIFYKRRRGNLYTVSQCDLLNYFKDIRKDYNRIIHATYFIDLLNTVTPNEDKNEKLFELILRTLETLNQERDSGAIRNIYEIKTLILSGFKPRVDSCIKCTQAVSEKAKFSTQFGGLLCSNCSSYDKAAVEIYNGTVASMLHIEKADFNNVWRLNLTVKVRNQLAEILDSFIKFHIDKNIKSKNFIESVS